MTLTVVASIKIRAYTHALTHSLIQSHTHSLKTALGIDTE